MEALNLSFGFVADSHLLLVLEEYYQQAQKAASGDSYLGVIVACGSVVEGLLTWALLQRRDEALKSVKAPKDKQGQVVPIDRWGLAPLIDVSADLGMIGKTAKQAALALKTSGTSFTRTTS